MEKRAKVRWVQNLQFVGMDTKGHSVVMDGRPPEEGGTGEGTGLSPSIMLLISLAGCTAMDVVSILRKKRQVVTGMEVNVIGLQPDTYPRPFQRIELEFTIRGKNINPAAVERAIELSENKYCVVGQTLKPTAEIVTSYRIEEDERF